MLSPYMYMYSGKILNVFQLDSDEQNFQIALQNKIKHETIETTILFYFIRLKEFYMRAIYDRSVF